MNPRSKPVDCRYRIIMGDAQVAPVRLWPVEAAHASFLAALAETRPRTIPTSPRAADLEHRAEHLDRVLTALSFYLSAVFDDTAANVPGGLDLRQIDALLRDLASEVSGTLGNAAEAVEEMVP